METQNRRNKVVFPIIADDTVLIPDNRVIMTNQELLTKTPEISEVYVPVHTETASDRRTPIIPEVDEEMTFETRRQMPTTEGKRPLGKTSHTSSELPIKKKTTVVEEARKRARENAVQPKPIKEYVNPLHRTTVEELGIKGLANKRVASTQHSLGQSISGFDKTSAQATNGALFNDADQDYFASKHQEHERVDTVE